MPRYQCHKIVEAAKIIEMDEQADDTAILTLDDFESVDPDCAPTRVPVPERIVRMMQQGGGTLVDEERETPDLGYFVRYEGGYESWSPTKAFKAGYSRMQGP